MKEIKGIGINLDSQYVNGDLNRLEALLEVFQSVGFDYVELPVHGLDLIINGKLNIEGLHQVKKILGKFPFKYTVHGLDCINCMNLQSLDMSNSIFKSTIDFAKEIKAELVVYHSGFINFDEIELTYISEKYGNLQPRKIYELILDHEIKLLRSFADYSFESGITIGIENNYYKESETFLSYGTRGSYLADFVSRVNRGNIRILYDFGHGYISSKINQFDFYEDIKSVVPLLGHIHLHDNFGKLTNINYNLEIFKIPLGIGDLHMPLGFGSIPYDDVFQIIKEYDGVYCLELQPRFHTYYKNSISHIKGVLNHLK